jgi:hypothetical protein
MSFVSLNFDHIVVAIKSRWFFFCPKNSIFKSFQFSTQKHIINILGTPINNSINSNSQKKVLKKQNQIGLDLFSLA